MLMTFHDQTPLRRVEEMRADFVANASHELRTPLAALSGFIDTLQGPAKEDAKARERFLGIMHTQATRMARLIDDLLSLSRVELSAHVRPDACVDIVPIIRQVADGLEPLAGERQVAIEIDLPETPVTIAGDREELLRLFENLIENALKYGASGGRVIVSLTQATSGEGAPEVRIMVRDFGPGIAPEHLPRLTERFYRVDVGDSRAQGGTGLGLSLVKHILNRHRGRLLIESVPKNGAVFTACFPQAKTPSAAINRSDSNRLDVSSNCHLTFVKALSTGPRRTAGGRDRAQQALRSPDGANHEFHQDNRRCRPGRRVDVGLRCRYHRRGRDLPLPDLFEVGRRLQEGDRQRSELPVDRLRRRHQADPGQDRDLRRHRRAAQA
jgi:two-component sensor histidine kinase